MKHLNIINAGVVMIVYLFIAITAYFLLSAPIGLIFDSFDDADAGDATSHLDTVIPTIRVVFNMFFAMMAAVPITWFIFWTMHREPDWGYQQ